MAARSRTRSLAALAAAAALLGAAPAPGAAASSSAASTAPSVDSLYCLSVGHARLECQATVSGGTGSLSYYWRPGPIAGSQDHVIVRCTLWAYQTVTVTVTDASGATASASGQFYCGDAV